MIRSRNVLIYTVFKGSAWSAYLVQWCRGAPRTQWLGCCFLAPALYPAGKKKSVKTSQHSWTVRIIVQRTIYHTFLFTAALFSCWPIWLGQIAPNTFLSLCIFVSSALATALQDHGLIWSWYRPNSPGLCLSMPRTRSSGPIKCTYLVSREWQRPRRLNWCRLTVFWAEV